MTIYFSGNGSLVNNGVVSIGQGGTGADNRVDAITNLLPSQIAKENYFLMSNGTDVIWDNPTGSTLRFDSITEVTTPLNNNEYQVINIDGSKAYILCKIETSVPAWVRVYSSIAERTNDLLRPIDQDPLSTSGVIAECITTPSKLKVIFTPGLNGFNDEDPQTNFIPITVTSLHNIASTVVVTLTIIKLIY